MGLDIDSLFVLHAKDVKNEFDSWCPGCIYLCDGAMPVKYFIGDSHYEWSGNGIFILDTGLCVSQFYPFRKVTYEGYIYSVKRVCNLHWVFVNLLAYGYFGQATDFFPLGMGLLDVL